MDNHYYCLRNLCQIVYSLENLNEFTKELKIYYILLQWAFKNEQVGQYTTIPTGTHVMARQ